MVKVARLFSYDSRPAQPWMRRLYIKRQPLPGVCDFDITITTSSRSGARFHHSEIQFDFGVRGDIVNLTDTVVVIDIQDFLVPSLTTALGDLIVHVSSDTQPTA